MNAFIEAPHDTEERDKAVPDTHSSDNVGTTEPEKLLFSRLDPKDTETLTQIVEIQSANTRDKILESLDSEAGGFLSFLSDPDFLAEHIDFERSTIIHEAIETAAGIVRGKVLGYLIGIPLDEACIDDHYYTESYARKCLEFIRKRVKLKLSMKEVLVGQIYLDPKVRGVRVQGEKQIDTKDGSWQKTAEIVNSDNTEGTERLSAKLYRFVYREREDIPTRKIWMARINPLNFASKNSHARSFRFRGIVRAAENTGTPLSDMIEGAADEIHTRDLTIEYPNEDQT